MRLHEVFLQRSVKDGCCDEATAMLAESGRAAARIYQDRLARLARVSEALIAAHQSAPSQAAPETAACQTGGGQMTASTVDTVRPSPRDVLSAISAPFRFRPDSGARSGAGEVLLFPFFHAFFLPPPPIFTPNHLISSIYDFCICPSSYVFFFKHLLSFSTIFRCSFHLSPPLSLLSIYLSFALHLASIDSRFGSAPDLIVTHGPRLIPDATPVM